MSQKNIYTIFQMIINKNGLNKWEEAKTPHEPSSPQKTAVEKDLRIAYKGEVSLSFEMQNYYRRRRQTDDIYSSRFNTYLKREMKNLR